MTGKDQNHERVGGIAGLAALVLGGVGGALERGWPSANQTSAVAEFIGAHRAAILGQSMVFLVAAVLNLVFFSSIASRLDRRSPNGSGSRLGFAFGAIWVALSAVAQAVQVGVAMAPTGSVGSGLLWTMAAAFGIANLPLGAMLAADARGFMATSAFPRWLGWISLAVFAAQILLFIGTVVERGPLAPNGWLTYVLYPLFAVWVVPTAVALLRNPHAPAPASPARSDVLSPQHLGV